MSGGVQPGPDVSARLAWPDDASAIARVQLTAWRHTYADVLDAEAMAGLDPDAVAAQWSRLISSPSDARVRTLVALERATIHGFTLVHPCADPDADPVADGEIGEFVVDPAHRDAGHGSRLVNAAVDTLRADGFGRAVWWVDAGDDALRSFVTASGWGPDGAHRELEAPGGRAVLKQVRLHTSLQ